MPDRRNPARSAASHNISSSTDSGANSLPPGGPTHTPPNPGANTTHTPVRAYSGPFNIGNTTPAGSSAFSAFRSRADRTGDSDIAQLSSTFESLVGQMLQTFKLECDEMKDRLQAEQERDREERESFRSDLFNIISRTSIAEAIAGSTPATAATGMPGGSTNTTPATPAAQGTGVATVPQLPPPARDRPPHLVLLTGMTVPPVRDVNPQFTVNISATQPIWKADLKSFSGLSRDVQTHLSICELAFQAELTPLSDTQKILVSLKHCSEGTPAAWYETCIHSLSSRTWANKTWSEYKISFVNTFGDPFLTSEGNRNMSSAVQREDETTSQFLLCFDGYRAMAGQLDPMFDIAMIRMLRDKLPPKVIHKAGDHVVNYEDFKVIVIKQDNKIRAPQSHGCGYL